MSAVVKEPVSEVLMQPGWEYLRRTGFLSGGVENEARVSSDPLRPVAWGEAQVYRRDEDAQPSAHVSFHIPCKGSTPEARQAEAEALARRAVDLLENITRADVVENARAQLRAALAVLEGDDVVTLTPKGLAATAREA